MKRRLGGQFNKFKRRDPLEPVKKKTGIAVKPYKKDFEYSYASGVFATLELLKYHPESILRVYINTQGAANKGLDKITDMCAELKIPMERANGLVVKLSHSENCYALGVFTKYQTTIEEDTNQVVLVSPSDMGNIGTIIRSMVGFNVTNLAIIRPAVDIYDPKVIRASTGSFFGINFEYFDSFEEYLEKHPHQNIYSFMLKGSKELSEAEMKRPYSLVFGNEGAGLPREYLNYGTSVRVDHSRSIDSLNLAVTVALALYCGYISE